LSDRTLGEEQVHAVSILGERAYLPTGPMRAAAILRRSVIFMAGLYRGANHYHVVFEPVADFSMSSLMTRDEAVRAAVERYARCWTNIAEAILTTGSISSIFGKSQALAPARDRP